MINTFFFLKQDRLHFDVNLKRIWRQRTDHRHEEVLYWIQVNAHNNKNRKSNVDIPYAEMWKAELNALPLHRTVPWPWFTEPRRKMNSFSLVFPLKMTGNVCVQHLKTSEGFSPPDAETKRIKVFLNETPGICRLVADVQRSVRSSNKQHVQVPSFITHWHLDKKNECDCWKSQLLPCQTQYSE